MSSLYTHYKRLQNSLPLRHYVSFFHYLLVRIKKAQLQVVAGYLSYVSLMSL